MPVNKQRKRNVNNVEKRDIKRRLIEISIRVDGYIYKNKPITIEEAEKYKHEISVHQTRCNNDKHMLQVIEKLMRCMKKIIEETPKTIPSLKNVSTPENFQCVDLSPGSSSIINKYEDNNVMIDLCYLKTLKEALSENKNQNSNIADNITISDSENEPPKTYKNEAKLPIHNGHINDVSMEGSINLNEKNNEIKSSNLNTLLKANVVEVHSIDVDTTQIALINNKNDKNTEYLKADQVYFKNIAHKPKEIMNDSVMTIVSSKIKRKYKKKITNNSANVQQTSIQPIRNDNTRNYKKKKISGVIQKPLPCDQPLNSQALVITNAPQIVSQKNKNHVPKNNADNDLPKATQKRKKSTNKNNNTKLSNIQSSITAPLFCAPNKYKHTPVDIISNEVALPVRTVHNNEVRNIVTYQDSVTRQMGALTIYNEHVLNDLSWVEGIRYVREIGTDEFDQASNTFDETFWSNFVLPKGWNDVDFLD